MPTPNLTPEPRPLPRDDPRPLRAAGLVWTALGIALTVKIAAAPELHTVYPKFAAGAAHWLAGQSLYAKYEELGAFRYSPTFAVLMTPFAALGSRWGGLAWSWLNIAAYVWAVKRWSRFLAPGEASIAKDGMLLMLALPAAVRGFWNGQSNPLVAAALLLGVTALARRRAWTAVLLLALATFLKLSPLVVGLLLAAITPRVMALRLIVALMAGALLPFLTQSPAYVFTQYREWLSYLTESGGARWPSFRDARTLWEWTGAGTDLRLYSALQAGAGLAVLAWCLWQRRRRGEQDRALFMLTLSMGITYLMLFGPAVEFATYPVMAPISAWVLFEAVDRRRGRWLAWAAYGLMAVFSFGAVERLLAPALPFAPAMLPLSTLLVACWLVRHAARPEAAANPPPGRPA